MEYRLICNHCGKIFYLPRKRKYCSTECMGMHVSWTKMEKLREKNKDRHLEISLRKPIDFKEEWIGEKDGYWYKSIDDLSGEKLECNVCHKKFYSNDKELNQMEYTFCSYECFCKSKIKYTHEQCLNCGKIYLRDEKDDFTQFCSELCRKNFIEKINDNKLPALISFRITECVNCHELYPNITNKSLFYCSLKCKNEFDEKSEFFEHSETGVSLNTRMQRSQTLRRNIMLGQLKFDNHSYVQGYHIGIPHFVRSTWEVNFSLILLHLNREYKYEAKTIKVNDNLVYMPDFYDVKRNIIYEIKGSWRGNDKEKTKQFMKTFPHIKLHIIDAKKYRRIYRYFGKKMMLVKSFKEERYNRDLCVMPIKEYQTITVISRERYLHMYGDNEHNPYKIWKDEYDEKLGL